jgi:nucleotidyltransferase substrate binding protein (TIGR01987 family)
MSSDSRKQAMLRCGAILEEMGRAVARLTNALEQPHNEFIRDAAIQRFEFSFELGWKGILALARLEGQDVSSPRSAISIALRNTWIDEETPWLDMLEDRNLTSQTYHESTAKQVFERLPQHGSALRKLHRNLTERLAEIMGPTPEETPKS